MGAWIEIKIIVRIFALNYVAPHDGCVDWNFCDVFTHVVQPRVAPHDGCVDWNLYYLSSNWLNLPSHPTMGAWIEILQIYYNVYMTYSRTPRWVRGLKSKGDKHNWNNADVAPHDGCVDWNTTTQQKLFYVSIVAPHDGCVDWNKKI